jgi:hypothetical protein
LGGDSACHPVRTLLGTKQRSDCFLSASRCELHRCSRLQRTRFGAASTTPGASINSPSGHAPMDYRPASADNVRATSHVLQVRLPSQSPRSSSTSAATTSSGRSRHPASAASTYNRLDLATDQGGRARRALPQRWRHAAQPSRGAGHDPLQSAGSRRTRRQRAQPSPAPHRLNPCTGAGPWGNNRATLDSTSRKEASSAR